MKSNLTRVQVIQRLQDSLNFFYTLKQHEFSSNFEEIDLMGGHLEEKQSQNPVHIKANFLGHYSNLPTKPFFIITYSKSIKRGFYLRMMCDNSTKKIDIVKGLIEHHGLSQRLVNILFFGEGCKLRTPEYLFKLDHKPVLNLQQSIERFRKVVFLLASDIIPLDFNYNYK